MVAARDVNMRGEPNTDGNPLDVIPQGRMLIAYSGGLHHVQAPGEGWPRLFRKVRMNLEWVDIGAYREERRREAGSDAAFKRAVVSDLERRRDLHCPTETYIAREAAGTASPADPG